MSIVLILALGCADDGGGDRQGDICRPAPEVAYDGIDQDCDGTDLVDVDGDGVPHDADCDDDDASIHPGAEEQWYDGIDQDCDGASDFDRDGDGFDAEEAGGADCDDDDPARVPADGDGDGWSTCTGDCDDHDATVAPDAAPDCADRRDTDCDGVRDCGISGVVDLDRAHAIVLGDVADGRAGATLAAAGDVDGDGLPELAVGRPGGWTRTDPRCGAVFLLSTPLPGLLPLDKVPTAVFGTDDCLGGAIAAGSDLDGDSVADLVLGIDSQGSEVFTDGGALVFLAPSGHATADDATITLRGLQPSDRTGAAVAVSTTLVGDAEPEVLIGSPGTGLGGFKAGRVSILDVSGGAVGTASIEAATVQIIGDTANQEDGSTLVVTDLDGDGVEDLILGGPGPWGVGSTLQPPHPGRVAVFYGPLSGTLAASSADVIVTGDINDGAGHAIAVADIDGGGRPDLVVGAPGMKDGGERPGGAYVLRGEGLVTGSLAALATTTLVGEGDLDHAGASVATGDLDGDGDMDLVVGAPQAPEPPVRWGMAYVVHDPAAHVDLAVEAGVRGDAPAEVGTAVLVPGDASGDGIDDLLVGGPLSDSGTGGVWLFQGGGL